MNYKYTRHLYHAGYIHAPLSAYSEIRAFCGVQKPYNWDQPEMFVYYANTSLIHCTTRRHTNLQAVCIACYRHPAAELSLLARL